MRRIRFVLFMSVAVISGAQSADKNGLLLPETKVVFAVSPAPVQNAVAFYAASGSDSDEVSGVLTLVIKTAGVWQVRQFPAVSGSQSNSNIAWSQDVAYVGTDEGIVRLRPGGKPEKIYSGEVDGLAISHDGARAAFWKNEDDDLTLTVLRLSDLRVVKTWTLPQNYSGDSDGFDLAFTAEGNSILARTYDEVNETPLKEFSFQTERVVTVVDVCDGLTSQGDHIFVLGKRKAIDKTSLLFQFSQGRVQQILGPIDDVGKKLAKSARPERVILTDSAKQEIVIWDTNKSVSDKISGCEDATSLGSGQLLFFRGAHILFGPSGCSVR